MPQSRKSWKYVALLIAPAAHVLLWASAYFGFLLPGNGAAWSWVVVLIVDWPLSQITVLVNGWARLLVFGTLWWFAISFCAYQILSAVCSRPSRPPQQK